MSTQTVNDLLGEDFTQDPLGEDRAGDNLYAGYTHGKAVAFVPAVQIGDGLAGPPNEQQLQIYRDERPIPADELGMQGPFVLPAVARHRAGRRFPLNDEWNAGLDLGMPGLVPAQDVLHPSPLDPGQSPFMHDGVAAPEVLPQAFTVYYTTSPDVGWEGSY